MFQNFTPTSTNFQNGRQQERFGFYGSTCSRQRILASTNSEVHSRLLHWVKMQMTIALINKLVKVFLQITYNQVQSTCIELQMTNIKL